MRFILLFLFVVIPMLEIAAFIQVGSLIGLWPTLLGIVLTAIIGAVLVRQQGFKALNEAREQSARQEVPVTPVIHGVFILIAGLLLLTPGFVTDSIGFLFLVPPVRLAIAGKVWRWIRENMDIQVVQPGGHADDRYRPSGDGPIIDGEAEDLTADDSRTKSTTDPSSPWASINHKKG